MPTWRSPLVKPINNLLPSGVNLNERGGQWVVCVLMTFASSPRSIYDNYISYYGNVSTTTQLSREVSFMWLDTVYCKSFEVANFHGFHGRSIIVKLFQWNSLCYRLWPYKTTIRLRMLHRETFHLEQFAIIRYAIGVVVHLVGRKFGSNKDYQTCLAW